jgi:hypothetical protein
VVVVEVVVIQIQVDHLALVVLVVEELQVETIVLVD